MTIKTRLAQLERAAERERDDGELMIRYMAAMHGVYVEEMTAETRATLADHLGQPVQEFANDLAAELGTTSQEIFTEVERLQVEAREWAQGRRII